MSDKVNYSNGILTCVQHKTKIKWIQMDKQVPFSETMLCTKCLEGKPTVSNSIIALAQAVAIINEKHSEKEKLRLRIKQQYADDIHEFQNKLKEFQSQIVQKFDEALRISAQWMVELQTVITQQEPLNLLKELECLNINSQMEEKVDTFQKNNQSYLTKISQLFSQYNFIEEYQSCLQLLNKFPRNNFSESINLQPQSLFIVNEKPQQIIQNMQSKNELPKSISYKIINKVPQIQFSGAIAFNSLGSLMVTGCNKDIKVFKFFKGTLTESKTLTEHTDDINCLVFSKKINWFASGSRDNKIRGWKEQLNSDWVCAKPEDQHSQYVICLLLNRNEDQLISCSYDCTIKIWRVNCQANQLSFGYTLDEKHTDYIYSISLNGSETALVSCANDKQIILWMKGANSQWKYRSHIQQPDYGKRISFINDNQIMWQQCNIGTTKIFEVISGLLKEKQDLQVSLNKVSGDDLLFPTIVNSKRQIIIQRHNKYVYVFRRQKNESFAIDSEPIDCNQKTNCGALTEDGEFLAIWNNGTKELIVYQMICG